MPPGGKKPKPPLKFSCINKYGVTCAAGRQRKGKKGGRTKKGKKKERATKNDGLRRRKGSSDLYGTGSRILLMIISNNLRVYNTRVRSDCKSKKFILKNSRFLLISKRFAVGHFPQRLVGEGLFV